MTENLPPSNDIDLNYTNISTIIINNVMTHNDS